jgi:proline iminopeptidase
MKKEKLTKTYPGDELISNPRKIIINSVIIKAPPEKIWPWLIQLGSGRAGWYSYDKIDNGGVPSAMNIIPELQHIKEGDVLPAVPNSRDSFLVQKAIPFKYLILVVPVMAASEEADNFKRMKSPLRVSWTLYLESLDNKTTKLISYGRISPDWLTYSPTNSTGTLFIERVYKIFSRVPWPLMLPFAMAGHYFMESRMLKGIKRRAESNV